MPSVPSYHWVFDCVHQADDVGPSSQVLQDLYFTLDLLLLDRLVGKEKTSKTNKDTALTQDCFRVLNKKTNKQKSRGVFLCAVSDS